MPHTYMLPSVATAAYNGMSHGPNGARVKFQNNEVNPILICFHCMLSVTVTMTREKRKLASNLIDAM